MNPKTRFLKMFYKLPEKARKELFIDFTTNPRSLNVVAIEVRADTKLGKELLEKLGYEEKYYNRNT